MKHLYYSVIQFITESECNQIARDVMILTYVLNVSVLPLFWSLSSHIKAYLNIMSLKIEEICIMIVIVLSVLL